MPDIMMDLLGAMLPAPEYATKEYVQARIAEAMNTAGSGPSVVLEPATFTANGTYQPDPGKAWDDVTVAVAGYAFHEIDVSLASATAPIDIIHQYIRECACWMIYPADADNTGTNTIMVSGPYYGNETVYWGSYVMLQCPFNMPNGTSVNPNINQYLVNDQTYNNVRVRNTASNKPAGNYKLRFYGVGV